jgi:hypothetical protein
MCSYRRWKRNPLFLRQTEKQRVAEDEKKKISARKWSFDSEAIQGGG